MRHRTVFRTVGAQLDELLKGFPWALALQAVQMQAAKNLSGRNAIPLLSVSNTQPILRQMP